MPAVNLSASPKFVSILSTGLPNVGGQVFTYLSGTSTPAATYSDAAGTIANANPIILDSLGSATIFLVQSQAYKFTVNDSLGNLLYTQDNVNYQGASGISQVFANGSAAAPSVSFVQAPTSGLYSPGVNQVGIAANGVQAVLVDASQNVGIGVAAPTQKLDVDGGARIAGATQITTGGLTVTAGGVAVTAGGLSVAAGGINVNGNSAVAGNLAISAGTFSSRGFVDNATAAAVSIDSAGRLLTSANLQTSFSATRGTSQTSGSTLLFGATQHNFGGAYNTGTSVFTAPVSGRYGFSVSSEFTNSSGAVQGLAMQITSNTQGSLAVQCFHFLASPTETAQISCSVASTYLAANEQISVTCTSLTSTLFATSAFSRFTGCLLG
jgi:hypothetical protein